MPNNEKQIEKLQKQVKRFEEKGYTDTAAHQMLNNLLHPVEGVTPRNTKKVNKEAQDGEQNLQGS